MIKFYKYDKHHKPKIGQKCLIRIIGKTALNPKLMNDYIVTAYYDIGKIDKRRRCFTQHRSDKGLHHPGIVYPDTCVRYWAKYPELNKKFVKSTRGKSEKFIVTHSGTL